jgi:hypothetical protein
LFVGFFSLLDAPNLPAFLRANSTRETAKENFSAALEEYVTGLTQAMTQEMLQDSMVAIHQEQGGRFEAYEAAIVATLNTNHARRNDLLKKMMESPTLGGTGTTTSNFDKEFSRTK